MESSKKAVVIGAGVAGMATAIRLRCMGFEVTVCEKNDYPGGKLSYFEQNGYRFDAGPSLFTQPQHIAEIFRVAGEPLQDYFQYRQVPVSCHYFFSNGKRVKAWADKERFAAEMHTQLGESPGHIRKYLQRSEKLYAQVGTLFLKHSLHKPSHFSLGEIMQALRAVRLPYLFSSLNAYNKRSFATPEAAQLFNRYATYNGSNPYSAPAMLSLIPHLEMNEGTFYPEGGMISITNALFALAEKKGVMFRFGQPVTRIITNAQSHVTAVETAGETLAADVVVSNQDVYFTYKNLLKAPEKAAGVLKQERSSSALIFYWGIRHNFDALGLHNIFFSANYGAEFDHIFRQGTICDDPTVYINITSKMEAGMAPANSENWFVMVNVPANTGQDWEALKADTRAKVLQKLSVMLGRDIASLIETESILDPLHIEAKTMSYMGSLYGTSSNSRMAAFMRHPNFSSGYKGLYFAGGSVHPGGGIPLCLRSAAIATRIIGEDFKAAPVHKS